MRVWDVNPGYLNRQSLLAEHREIHAIFSIITKGKKGYSRQFDILRGKYSDREQGRIPLPVNCQQLWAQHKYSVMARDPGYYKIVGPLVSANDNKELFTRLAVEFIELLLKPPPQGRLLNAVQHMWGYISPFISQSETRADLHWLMETIRRASFTHRITYLMQSTALSDLALYTGK
ncbi:MAG: DUF1722 domain-containing protein [Candidatus Aminicenantes bacterium]|nr:DUF1722 domain-containing protein [Candidatus Aminicenantes bacterium]